MSLSALTHCSACWCFGTCGLKQRIEKRAEGAECRTRLRVISECAVRSRVYAHLPKWWLGRDFLQENLWRSLELLMNMISYQKGLNMVVIKTTASVQ